MGAFVNSIISGQIANSPQVIFQSSTPIGIAPSGTMGANGALTVPALPFTYSAANCRGIWWYFPAGAVYAGSLAGIYWTVMTSTTLGTVFNNNYTTGATTPPASPTAVVDAGPGAYSAPSTEITLLSMTIPGGSMGPNGKLRKSFSLNATNSANTKTFFERFNGTTSGIGQVLTTSPSYNIISEFRNRGVVGGNMSSSNSGMAGPSSVSSFNAINTAADMTYTLTGTLTAAGSLAGEFMAYEHLCIELFPG